MTNSRFLEHPIWLAGFRPFFTLAFVSGAVLPLLWGAVFAGRVSLPASSLSPVVWHGHEMLYGFGWAVLGGFLLTASKNWVKVRGIHGGPLAFAVVLWLAERGAMLWANAMPLAVRFVVLNLSVVFVVSYVLRTLIVHRRNDSFPDNYFFVLALPLLLVSKSLMLQLETFATGVAMTTGLFRVAFVVMLERTMPPFMKAATGVTLPRVKALDFSLKALTLVAVFQAFLPARVAAALLVVIAVLLVVRFLLWSPLAGLRVFGTGVMYVGHLGLAVHLVLEAARLTGAFPMLGALSLHAFTFLTMGPIIPAMLVRICQGHTGRKPAFTFSDRVAIWLLGVGAFFRLVATQLWPARYTTWIALSAIGWALCFVIVGVRLTPYLFRPRIDGRVH